MILIRIYRIGEVYALRDQRAGASPVAKEKPGFGCSSAVVSRFLLFQFKAVLFLKFKFFLKSLLFRFIKIPFKMFKLFPGLS